MGESISASRGFIITSNNPQNHYEWAEIDYETATEEDYQRVLIEAIALHVEGRNGACRSPERNGALAVFEEGSCPHFHLLVFSSSPIKFKALQAKFDHSEIEPVRGTVEEAVAYLYKEGKHADKQDTQKCMPVCWGEYFSGDAETSEKRSVFAEIDELIEQGLKPRDIYKLGSKYAYYRNAIEAAYAARREAAIPLKRSLSSVVYHVGASGTGKSATYWHLVEHYGKENVFMVNGAYKHIFDFYAYEPTLMLDDLRGDDIPLNVLLGLLDEYPMLARCRYQDKRLAYTEVHITSVIPPENLYCFYGFEEFEQLRRRLTTVVYHWKEKGGDGEDVYRQFSVPASEYEGYYKLKRLAMGLDAPREK